MKLFTVLVTMLIATTTLAGEITASRGYILQGPNKKESYAGITDNNIDVGFLLAYYYVNYMLDDAQLDAMDACMLKKETHAIQVVQESIPTQAPADNGKMVTVHTSKIKEINCVSAPGFLQVWRKFYNAGSVN